MLTENIIITLGTGILTGIILTICYYTDKDFKRQLKINEKSMEYCILENKLTSEILDLKRENETLKEENNILRDQLIENNTIFKKIIEETPVITNTLKKSIRIPQEAEDDTI